MNDFMDNSDPVAQSAAMRNTVGLPPSDEAANKQKAMDMMRSIVGLNPNTNNYSLQDAISQLKGQYTAPGGPQGMGAMGTPMMGANSQGGPQGMGAMAPSNAAIGNGPASGIGTAIAGRGLPPEVYAPQDQPMDYGGMDMAGGGMKHGGKIKAFSKGGSTGRDGIAQRGKTKAFAKGGSVSASSRGDGCAQRGKTRGMMR